ncbi:MAG TPA: hypothetical protein QF353_02440 [Gammaproteobacteria bacterium]|nr:hypothetical protein [Gammaproteobacteria bacterium]
MVSLLQFSWVNSFYKSLSSFSIFSLQNNSSNKVNPTITSLGIFAKNLKTPSASNTHPSTFSTFKEEIVGVVFYLAMTLAHHWAWFGSHGSLLWGICFIACTVTTCWVGRSIFESYALDLMRLGSLMTIAFVGVALSVSGLAVGLGTVMVAACILGLMRSLLGHMGESNSDWLSAMLKITACQLVLFPLLFVMGASLSVQIVAWMVVSTGFIYFDWPKKFYSGAGMVATSFVSSYLSWLVSSSVFLFPGFMHALGAHVFYHDALLTMVAISLGSKLKKRIRDSALKEVNKHTFPDLNIYRDGEYQLCSQKKLKVGDQFLLSKHETLLPGITAQVEEVSDAFAVNQGEEQSSIAVNVRAKLGHHLRFSKLEKGSVMASVESVDPTKMRNYLRDPGESYMNYFVPALLVASLLVGLFWLSVGNPMLAISVVVNMLLVACPCVFTIAIPILEARAESKYNKLTNGLKVVSLDAIKSSHVNVLVIDRTRTLVNGDNSTGVWAMDRNGKTALKTLVNDVNPKLLLVLSGHDDTGAEKQMKTDLLSALEGTDWITGGQLNGNVKTWMNDAFNQVQGGARAKVNKAKVIAHLQSEGELSDGDCCRKKIIADDSEIKSKKAYSVMMVGDGNNDIEALKFADIGVHVGDDAGVLALSGVGVHIEKFDNIKDQSIKSLLKLVGEYQEISRWFKLAALVFNACVVFLAAGGSWFLWGAMMNPGVSCTLMAMFSVSLAAYATQYEFLSTIRDPVSTDKPVSAASIGWKLWSCCHQVYEGVSATFEEAAKPPEQGSCCEGK